MTEVGSTWTFVFANERLIFQKYMTSGKFVIIMSNLQDTNQTPILEI